MYINVLKLVIDKPMIYNKSKSIFEKKTNESVIFFCNILGNSRPTIIRFKVRNIIDQACPLLTQI